MDITKHKFPWNKFLFKEDRYVIKMIINESAFWRNIWSIVMVRGYTQRKLTTLTKIIIQHQMCVTF